MKKLLSTLAMLTMFSIGCSNTNEVVDNKETNKETNNTSINADEEETNKKELDGKKESSEQEVQDFVNSKGEVIFRGTLEDFEIHVLKSKKIPKEEIFEDENGVKMKRIYDAGDKIFYEFPIISNLIHEKFRDSTFEFRNTSGEVVSKMWIVTHYNLSLEELLERSYNVEHGKPGDKNFLPEKYRNTSYYFVRDIEKENATIHEFLTKEEEYFDIKTKIKLTNGEEKEEHYKIFMDIIDSMEVSKYSDLYKKPPTQEEIDEIEKMHIEAFLEDKQNLTPEQIALFEKRLNEINEKN